MLMTKMVPYAETILEYLFYGLPAVLTFSRALTEILLATIVVLAILLQVYKKEYKILRCSLWKPCLAFCLAGIFSLFGSDFFFKSFKELFSFLEFVLVSLIAFEIFQEERVRKNFATIIVFVVLYIGLDALFQYIFHYDLLAGKQPAYVGDAVRVTASFSHPNSLGAFLAMMIPVVAGIFSLYRTWAAWGAMLFLCIPLALTYSRGAWIALTFGMIFYCLKKKDWKFLFVLASVFTVFLFLAPESLSLRMREIFDLGDLTIQSRLDAWGSGWNLFLEKPFLGHGLKSYSLILKQGYTHNCYLQILVEMGILGLASFCWVLWSFFSFFVNRKADAFSLGAASGVLAGAIHSFSDTILYSTPTAALFWLLIGVGMGSHALQKESGDLAKDNKT